jgi:hypothetical protein
MNIFANLRNIVLKCNQSQKQKQKSLFVHVCGA